MFPSKESCSTPTSLRIYTVGHSTRTAEDFVRLLHAHGIRQLADIRTVPASRRHPHFAKSALDTLLASSGIEYRHFAGLGGLRKPKPDSANTAWRHPSFRGYADHMATIEFRDAVDALESFAALAPTTVMCAEAVWWQCHRRLLADTLLFRGVEVWHILSLAAPKPHELSEFARPAGAGVIYPGLL